jgi:DNA-binding GntR family transcriptional regulator
MSTNGLPKPAALTEWTYQKIKDDILNLEIKPGEQLHVEEFAEKLGISRTPIREAFLKLEGEGFIETVPRVGYFVVKITKQDIIELFELREILEMRATKNAVAFLSDEEIDELDSLISDSTSAVEHGNLSRYLEIDIHFHDLLLKHAQNRRLVAFMESIRDLTYRERVLSIRSQTNVHETLREHQQIIKAIRKRDGELASQLMGEHLRSACQRILQYIDQNQGE